MFEMPKKYYVELMKMLDVVKTKTSPEWVELMKDPCNPDKGTYVCDGTEDEPEPGDPFYDVISLHNYKYIRGMARNEGVDQLPKPSKDIYQQLMKAFKIATEASSSGPGLPKTGV